MFRRILLLYIGLNLLVLVGGFGVLFFTPFPMSVYVSLLEGTGAKVTDARGTLYTGVSIGKIEWSDPAKGISSTVEGIQFRYSRVFEIFKTRRIEIDHYTIDKVALKLPAADPKAMAYEAMGGGAKPAADSGAKKPIAKTPTEEMLEKVMQYAFTGEDPLLRGVGIGDLRISNTRVELGTENFEFQQVQYKNLAVGPGFSLGELFVSTGKYEFRARGFTFDRKIAKLDGIDGRLKVGYDPDRLKQDLDFSLKTEGSFKEIGKMTGSLQALGGKVRVRIGAGGMASFSISDLTVRELYSEPLPITHLNLEVNEAPFMAILAGQVDVRGGFVLGSTPFRFATVDERARSNGTLLRGTAMIGKHLFTLDFGQKSRTSVFAAAMSVGAKPAAEEKLPPLSLRSTFSESSQDNLAFLLHGAMYADLDEIKRLQVDTELKHFDRRIPAAAKRVVQAAKPVKLEKKKLRRSPAGKKPIGRR